LGQKMRLYRKEKGLCDYWEVHINFPWVGKRKQYVDIVGVVEGTEYGLSFPTKCCLHKEDEFFWFFTLRILGFGMTITRQNGY
jgi:hypothetical protein